MPPINDVKRIDQHVSRHPKLEPPWAPRADNRRKLLKALGDNHCLASGIEFYGINRAADLSTAEAGVPD